MKRKADLLSICALVLMMSLLACSDSAPVPPPNTISKPIAVQKIKQEGAVEPKKVLKTEEGSSAQQVAAAPVQESAAQQSPAADMTKADPPAVKPEEPAAELEKRSQEPLPEHQGGGKAPDVPEIPENLPLSPLPGTDSIEPPVQPVPQLATGEPTQEIEGRLQVAGTYDPKDRFDPFEPLFKVQSSDTAAASKSLREKRAPQTPLERVALSQLKVTAIIRSAAGNRALVEDAGGKGYVVQRGTYIGLNAGRVIDIDKNRIVVEEEIENIMGELTIQNAELKLQKTAGEL